ncbi:ESCRT-0 subunit protein hse1 [Friedmanniomyces endolithicus]|uniref:Class E vacuolar protein-sorting machinery protein HSE1 n=1 Tax=Friedmanniomyces endolithicus TaxID=329885 RepID=A0AAN6R316_9PEZI|nr:ESCRT-0 subunit protein hse1 [Friedmanniomyces endolithicus]KAK0323793.1 ESCRT-0 subunit protein hse1 [Friedmanniomyces endolithicus]KAK1010813.1 ESCRT-0 subunit protein hse1 [Friedmanniomyces endolithicus]KAK1016323.1 ESCRT-0 subunit protein hse1 [Friedmanniomyces endolithicus]
MFRQQANPMEEAVVRATDENLTSENWELILDVCDRVSASTSGPQQAIAALIKRLAHRNANVQLYTLELANALSQNCGAPLHRELASKAFTDSLLRLAGDRNSHAQVKQKVMERMETWTELFGRSPELGIMEQAWQKLRLSQPGLQAPSKPVKMQISSEDRRKEDEELQMALALSVQQDKAASPAATAAAVSSEEADAALAGAAQQQQQQGTTAATVSRVRALYDFVPSEKGELAFQKNDVIAVLESVYKDWWKGSLHGQTGIFPLNYVEKLPDPTKEELERDAQMEAEVFGEIKNVEKLLALLSVPDGGGSRRGEREEEEIGELYQKTLSIRPKLIELIGKYSQKKDEFTQLNEKFVKARRDYEYLLEGSMAAPQQYQQHYPVRPRQSSYPPQHQQPYQQGPSQGYPPQGPQAAHGYPPQQPIASQSQQHLPPPQQDVQRFFSPAPSEPPGQQQPGYPSPYPPQAGPPAVQAMDAGAPAPFHFIPGGLQAPPPSQQQSPPQQQEQQAIRRKPSPQGPPGGSYGGGQAPPAFQGQIRPNSIHTINSGNPQELATGGYESPVDVRQSYPPSLQQQQQQQRQQQMQGGMPPPGYPPPTSDPYAQQIPPPHHQQHHHHHQHQHQHQPPPQQQQQLQQQPQQMPPPRSDRDSLPSRQRTQSFESSTSLYSQQHSGIEPPTQYSASGGQLPQQPSGPPPGVPSSPTVSMMAPQYSGGGQGYTQQHQQALGVVPESPPTQMLAPQYSGGGQGYPPQQQQLQQHQPPAQQYQAFSPGMEEQLGQRVVSGGSGAGDPGEFYR